MKRLICILFAAVMLLGTAAADGQVIIPWEGDCPHLLCDFGVVITPHQEYMADIADPTGYSSAVCSYCQEVYLLCPDGAALQVQPADAQACTHVICTKGEKLSEGWEPTFNSFAEVNGREVQYFSSLHEYRVYYACTCAACGKKLHYYEGLQVNGMGITQHEFEEIGASVSTHLHEQNRHLYMVQCTVCGYYTAMLQPCYVFDNGLCQVQMNEAQRFYMEE